MKVIYDINDDLHRAAHQFFLSQIEQEGGFLPVFVERGHYGEGFGSMFSGFMRRYIMPYVFSGGKALTQQALNTATDYIGDLASGADWREAGKGRIKEAVDSLGNKLSAKLMGQSGSGLRMPTYYNSHGMRTGPQFGSGARRRNKTIHNAVKLFSFVPPAAERGRALVQRRQRRRRRRRATTKPGVSGGKVTKRRRRVTKRKRVSPASSKTTRRGRRRGKKRAASTKRVAVKRRRKATQKGRGFPLGSDWF
jgi:hypothetical protein